MTVAGALAGLGKEPTPRAVEPTVRSETPLAWIGIDPGIKGGIAGIFGSHVHVTPMPTVEANGRTTYDIAEIVYLLRSAAKERPHAILERQQPMPAMLARAGGGVVNASGGIANYHRGLGRGLFEGILTALGIPYELVGPRQWQDEMLPLKGGDTKQRSIAAAKKLFPDVNLYATARSRKESDGLSDALLIAAWGRKTWA